MLLTATPETNTRLNVSPIVLLRQSTALVRLDRAADNGALVRIARGVYADAAEWHDLPPWSRYLTRVHATALLRPDAVFSHESAAALLGLPVFGHPPEVHVLRDPLGTSRAQAGVREHTTVDLRDVLHVDGIMVTTPEETAVDIARARHPAVAIAVSDAVLRSDRSLTCERLREANLRRASSRGRRHGERAIVAANPLAETPLESVSRAAIDWLGFASPELQHVLTTPDGRERRLDFLWRREAIAGEADGRSKYDGRFGDPSLLAFNEKRREDSLRRVLRGFARWGWSELQHPGELRGILLDAGLKPQEPAHLALLGSLRRALTGAPR
ncbi:type IV toxin-antitoxin system AbiEi family antitoxin domain-containing protein [Micromonospora sp. DT81.3]|uniref:type IV toxin-antitoxin system AbiEi family antitoxin domain-containing protein n=1 Tax=Actinomycetes TaxID=1760 RepID=UPI003CEDFAC3